jgi:hypothetical protein
MLFVAFVELTHAQLALGGAVLVQYGAWSIVDDSHT